jgi:hypothetical protein
MRDDPETITFHGVFAALSEVARCAPPAGEAVRRLLTLDGRLPLEHGLQGLADFDRELFVRLETAPDVRLTPDPDDTRPGRVVEAAWNTIGRVYLRPRETPPPAPEPLTLRRIGWLTVPDAMFDAAAAAAADEQARERLERERLDTLLAAAARDGRLGAIVDGAADAVRHVEAFCCYIDDCVYASMERVQTVIGGPSILRRLRDSACPEQWTPDERLAVIALHALFLTGSSIRFEEFNGAALTARRLVARIRELADRYEAHGMEVGACDADLFTLSEAIGRAAKTSFRHPFLRYRVVSGWTFRKNERHTVLPAADATPQFSPRLAAFAAPWIGRPFDGSAGAAEDAARALVAATAADEGTRAPGEATPVEEWIRTIVASAVHVTSADYGMSSSLRRVGPLVRAAAGDQLALILTLKPPDFFCCVTGRPGLSREVGAAVARDIYGPVRMRMQFNRWHFICGNHPAAQIPRERHWFYPPTMPDIAEWSDVWHAGHTRAGVRYSVRAPGPDMSLPPLRIGAHDFRGFYDVRVVRMGGEPFGLDDLLITRQHCLWMGALWRELVASGAVDITGLDIGYEPDEVLEVAL